MSAVARHQMFSTIHSIGGLLPTDMLARISDGRDVDGCTPTDYHVLGAHSVRDDAERHWDYLRSAWAELRRHLPGAWEADVPADPTGLATTQWLRPLFKELGFGQLTAIDAAGIAADDATKTFPISHRWNHVPIHLVPWNVALDKRPGGAGTIPAQSMVQECLNRCQEHLWAVLSNGRQLRLLRDSSSVATSSYLEFDLETIFDGELFSDFVLLYRLLHVSRFEVAERAALPTCWLEKWRTKAISSGVRALEHHRRAVREAITALGNGFLRHPANRALRKNFDVNAFHAALLRLVYRLIFLFVVEDRDVLHPPDATETARRRYAAYFSSARLRRQSDRAGNAHTDLYQALRIVLDALGDENGHPQLGLPGLGGLFDSSEVDAPLRGFSLANSDLLTAVRRLSRVRDTGSARWRIVDYRNMGSEELGSIYESLLELVPVYSAAAGSFELVERLGNNRKKTGSYYTPSSLVERLLDTTLDRVVDDTQKRGELLASASAQPDSSEIIAGELLSLTVCDPACGSGNFLLAAARRIAKRVAAVRERNPEPTLDAVRRALHEVIARCIYGVDLNPMAVELAKVSLWLEGMEPGKPLSFLDAHLKHGNALIGATPALLRAGIPNKAFKPFEGDDPAYARLLERQNDAERRGQNVISGMEDVSGLADKGPAAAHLRQVVNAPAETLIEVRRQRAAYHDWQGSVEYAQARHIADAWCAAFVWHKHQDAPQPITDAVFRALQGLAAGAVSQATRDEIVRLRKLHRFFHWHLEFPTVFEVPQDGSVPDADNATGRVGGFSCVVSNPPWDKVDFEDKKYFGIVVPSIAKIAGLARRDHITQWSAENPRAAALYRAERRTAKSTFHFARGSGLYPLCTEGLKVKGVNSLQSDQLFTENLISLAAPKGRLGLVVPTNIATGASAQHLFKSLSSLGSLTSMYDFENRNSLFLDIDSRLRFCLISLAGRDLVETGSKLAFLLLDPADLDNTELTYTLTAEEVASINPNTGTLPTFRSRHDADITTAIYRRFPALKANSADAQDPWMVDFKNLFHLTDDSNMFRDRSSLEDEGWTLRGNTYIRGTQRMLPVYEGKMAHLFDHRWASYDQGTNRPARLMTDTEKTSPLAAAQGRYWVTEDSDDGARKSVESRLADAGWRHEWICGWRDVSRATDERTAIAAFLSRVAVGHTFPLMLARVEPKLTAALVATQSSLVFDYVSRQKITGAHMSLMVWKQLPVPTPAMLLPHTPFITARVLELVYTAYDMAALARDLEDHGPPFQWDEGRRWRIRAELDAYFFHLYGISRQDTEYILETFQSDSGGGLKNNEIATYGTYRTKDLVLAEYDRMAVAGVCLDVPLADYHRQTPVMGGSEFRGEARPYRSDLDPPPGFGPRHKAGAEAPPPPRRIWFLGWGEPLGWPLLIGAPVHLGDPRGRDATSHGRVVTTCLPPRMPLRRLVQPHPIGLPTGHRSEAKSM